MANGAMESNRNGGHYRPGVALAIGNETLGNEAALEITLTPFNVRTLAN